MSKTICIGNLTLGEGIPKICMGLAGTDFDIVLAVYEKIRGEKADLIEWRTDRLLGGMYRDVDEINRVLSEIAKGDSRPVILTLRTEQEGGKAPVSGSDYHDLIRSYITDTTADAVDIEAFHRGGGESREVVEFLAQLAHENGKTAILSNHDFARTPARKEITQRLLRMAQMGADLPKVAYMPQNEDDVHTLLAAAADARESIDVPFIALSMGQLGMPSRVCGGTVGSCVTFGASSQLATAPGQIPISQLSDYLKAYYEAE